MPKSTHSKDDVYIELRIDPYFTGIMRGFADDEAEGCVLKGTCHVHAQRPVKLRRLMIRFEGRSKVSLRGHGPISMSSPEFNEIRMIYSKTIDFIEEDDDGRIHTLPAGEHVFDFEFDLPSTLPASFKGKYGSIRYRLFANLYRPSLFSSDVHATRDIILRRSVMSDLTSLSDITDTVHGENKAEQIKYSATAPAMAYREGGLVRLDLSVLLGRPEFQSVRSVTCALRETVQYRTTGERSLTCQACGKTEDLFPLGWSTFYPSQGSEYNPHLEHNYNAIFRLCPRVNADTESRLLRVSHAIVVNIMVETKQEDALDIQKLHDALAQLPTPPASRPSSPPPLVRSSSSSSISSFFSMCRKHHNDDSKATSRAESAASSRASSRRSSISASSPKPMTHLSLCSLEIPILVTSREHVWEGDMPTPPAYNVNETPPSYFETLAQLPAVPIYPTPATAETA